MIQMNLGAFVQNIKVTICGFIVRHQEHTKEKNASGSFFFVYPLQQAGNQTTRHKQGVFQALGNAMLQDFIQSVLLH
jgi:hypothetical protein